MIGMEHFLELWASHTVAVVLEHAGTLEFGWKYQPEHRLVTHMGVSINGMDGLKWTTVLKRMIGGGTPQVRKPPYGYTIYILTNIDQPYVVFNLLCFILLMIFMLFLRKQQILSRLASVVSSCVAHHPWVTTLTDGHSLRHRASPWAQEWNSSLAQREICGAEWGDHGRLDCDVRMVQEVTMKMTGLRLGFHSLIRYFIIPWSLRCVFYIPLPYVGNLRDSPVRCRVMAFRWKMTCTCVWRT